MAQYLASHLRKCDYPDLANKLNDLQTALPSPKYEPYATLSRIECAMINWDIFIADALAAAPPVNLVLLLIYLEHHGKLKLKIIFISYFIAHTASRKLHEDFIGGYFAIMSTPKLNYYSKIAKASLVTSTRALFDYLEAEQKYHTDDLSYIIMPIITAFNRATFTKKMYSFINGKFLHFVKETDEVAPTLAEAAINKILRNRTVIFHPIPPAIEVS